MNQIRRILMMLLVLLLTTGIVPGLADPDPPPKIYLPFITSSNPVCNRVVNSGFEEGTGTDADNWEQTVSIAAERTTINFAGTHSMQTEIPSGTDIAGYSQFYQDVPIPAGAENAVLSYWVYTHSSEAPPDLMPEPPPLSADIYGPATPDYDTQFGYLQTTSGDHLEKLFWLTASDSDSWNSMQFDVSDYEGQTVRVLFGTYNNGPVSPFGTGKTAMWVDEVYLDACDPPPPPPPPPPPVCNRVVNSGFEEGTGTDADNWEQTVSIAAERTEYFAGTHSMQTGIPSGTDTAGYSQFYQDVPIPAGAVNAVLSYWVYTHSSETPPDLMPEPPPLSADIYGPATPDYDTQFGYLQTTSGDHLEKLFWLTASDSDSWNSMQFDVSDYEGQTVRVLFGTYNNGFGGKTAMWVDEVYLDACEP